MKRLRNRKVISRIQSCAPASSQSAPPPRPRTGCSADRRSVRDAAMNPISSTPKSQTRLVGCACTRASSQSATLRMAARICFACSAGERSVASGPGSSGWSPGEGSATLFAACCAKHAPLDAANCAAIKIPTSTTAQPAAPSVLPCPRILGLPRSRPQFAALFAACARTRSPPFSVSPHARSRARSPRPCRVHVYLDKVTPIGHPSRQLVLLVPRTALIPLP